MTTRARRAARRSVYRRLERDDRSRARGDGAWRGPRPANATARRCSSSGDMPRLRAPFPHVCKRRGRAKPSRRRASSPPPAPRLRKPDRARAIGEPIDLQASFPGGMLQAECRIRRLPGGRGRRGCGGRCDQGGGVGSQWRDRLEVTEAELDHEHTSLN